MSVALVGPDGTEYDFDGSAADLEAAKAQGFRVAEEIGAIEGALDTAKAAFVGAAEGVTGGLLGAGLGAGQGDEETPQSAKARWSNAAEMNRLRAESPIASTVGEVGGMLVSPLNAVGGGVTRAIGATTKLGRVAAEAAGGASSGLLFGAGKTVSDAALGDVDLTAEKLVAGAGLGALLGGAGGGLGGAITEGARAVMPKAATLAKRAQSALDDIANDATILATRAQQYVVNRLGDVRAKAAAGAMRKEGVLDGSLFTSPDDMLKLLEQKIGRTGAERAAILDLAEAGGAKPDYSEIIKRLDEFERSLNPLQRKIIKRELAELRDGALEIGARPVTASGKGGSNFAALDDLRQSVAKRGKFSRGAAGVDDESLQFKRQLAGVFRDELDRQLVPQLGSDIGRHWGDTKALYGALKDAATLAKSGAGRAQPGGLGLGLYDLLSGVAGAALHPMGLAAAVGSKVLREQGPAIAARIADRLAKEPALQAMARSFAASLPTTAPKLGPYGAVLAQEAAVSPERALATHMAYAQLDPSYAATAQLAGLTPEQPDEHGPALARAQTLAEAQAAAAAQDEAVRKGVDRVARGGGAIAEGRAMKSQDFGAMRMRRDGSAAYDKRVTELRELATNPAALIERVAANLEGLSSTAPGVAVAMQATAQRAVTYLAQQSEVPPKAGPLAAEWDPPEADRQAFTEKLEVVQEPMSVLDSAAAGALTEQQMDALRAVYPRLAQQMADAALERMVSGAPVPYAQRFMLLMVSGVDPDGSFSPAAVAANQTAINAAKQVGPVAPVGNEASDVTLANRTATPSHRREVRQDE